MNDAYAGAGPLPDPTITREAFSDRRPSARQAVPCFRGNSALLGPTLVSRDRDATQEMIMNMFKMAAMLEANLANLDALTQGFSPMREGRLSPPLHHSIVSAIFWIVSIILALAFFVLID